MMRSFIPLAIAFLVFLASVGVYAGGYYLLTTLNAKATTLAQQEASKEASLERTTRAHTALTTLAGSDTSLDQYVLTKNDIVPFLEVLQSTGQPFGTSVDVLSVTDTKDKTHQRIQLSLSLHGSFDGVMRTLGTIEYSPYDGVLSNVSLNTETTASSTRWTADAVYSVGLRTGTTTP